MGKSDSPAGRVAVAIPDKEDIAMLTPLPEEKQMTVEFKQICCWVSGEGRAWASPGASGSHGATVASELPQWPVSCHCGGFWHNASAVWALQVPKMFGPPSTMDSIRKISVKSIAALPSQKSLTAAEAAAKEDMRQVGALLPSTQLATTTAAAAAAAPVANAALPVLRHVASVTPYARQGLLALAWGSLTGLTWSHLWNRIAAAHLGWAAGLVRVCGCALTPVCSLKSCVVQQQGCWGLASQLGVIQ
jgi:hypothetical protein